ncbi:MAG: outer membrane beta-barrel family protein, partial [Cyclobacteriaceae bacterium]|nr:outer membrane beta-barrel family protein [Cyclobacteriaceae bacterium]
EKSPGVNVDRQNGGLSLMGKSGVRVMINGKISRVPMATVVQMLEGMSSDNIEKIELITTPPAKYDAEGDAGLINIVMIERNDLGTNGSYTFNGAFGLLPKGGGSVNFNHRNKAVNIFGDVNVNYINRHQNFYSDFIYYDPVNLNNIESNDINLRIESYLYNRVNLGTDWFINDRTILGVVFSAFDDPRGYVSDNSNRIYVDDQLNATTANDMKEINHWQNLMGNINFQHTFKNGGTINLDGDYLYYWDNQNIDYDFTLTSTSPYSREAVDTRLQKHTPIEMRVYKLDFTKKIKKGLNFESGIKSSLSGLTNNVLAERKPAEQWMQDDEFTSKYFLDENIHAAYSSFDYQLSKKRSVKGGVRWEYTNTELGEIGSGSLLVDRKYHNFFPSLYFSQELGEQSNINVSYARRITRPSYNELAPFVYFTGPNSFWSGNVNLQPTISNLFKVGFNYKSYLVTLSYSLDENAIGSFSPHLTASNKLVSFAENFPKQTVWSASLSLPFSVTSWWEMQNTINGNFTEIYMDYTGVEELREYWSYNVVSNQNFILPKNFSFQVSGFYYSSAGYGLWKMNPFGTLNIGIHKKLGENTDLKLIYNDILWTSKYTYSASVPNINLISSIDKFEMETRVVRLSFTHRFGNNKLKASRNRKTGSTEEQQRVN